MNLGTHDLHVLLSRTDRSCNVYAPGGKKVFECECRNRTVNDSGLPSVKFAPCPPGEFVLGAPIAKNTPPFGPFFILLADYDGNHAMADNGRGGIGVHGGGSGLADWNAPRQSAFVVTLGCWRFMNTDLDKLVGLVRGSHAGGGVVYATVAPFTSGRPGAAAPASDEVPDLDVPVGQLDPDE